MYTGPGGKTMALSRELTDAERRALDKRKTHEILCDHPGCRNIAVEVIGVVRDINGKFAVCAEHLNVPADITKGNK